MRLEKRISLTTSILILGLLVCICLILAHTIKSSEKARLVGTQQAAQTLYKELQKQRFENLLSKASLLANLPQIKAALSTNDSATIVDVLSSMQKTSQLHMLFAINTNGLVYGKNNQKYQKTFSSLIEKTRTTQKATLSFENNNGQIIQVVATPILFGSQVKHILITGFKMGKPFLKKLNEMTQTHFALKSVQDNLLLHITANNSDFLKNLPSLPALKQKNYEYHSSFIYSTFSLLNSDQKEVARLYAFRTLSEGMQVANKLQKQIIFFAILFCLFGLFISVTVARSISKPIKTLTDTLNEIDLSDPETCTKISEKTNFIAPDKDIQTVYSIITRILRTMDYERDQFFETINNHSQAMEEKLQALECENKNLDEANAQLRQLVEKKHEAV